MDRTEIAKEMLKRLSDLDELTEIENLLKDNVIEFYVKNIKYRLRKPTQEEKLEVKNKRTEKYIELLKDNKYLFKQQLIDLYKQKGIDIKEFEIKRSEIQEEINKLLLKLAELGNMPNDNPSVIELRNKIMDLRQLQLDIFLQEQELMSHCIENILFEFTHLYFIYLLLDKEDNGKWIKAFNSYDEFMKCTDNELIDKSAYYLTLLIENYEVR